MSPVLADCTIVNMFVRGIGRSVVDVWSPAAFEGCIFRNNVVEHPKTQGIEAVITVYSVPVGLLLQDCAFINNKVNVSSDTESFMCDVYEVKVAEGEMNVYSDMPYGNRTSNCNDSPGLDVWLDTEKANAAHLPLAAVPQDSFVNSSDERLASVQQVCFHFFPHTCTWCSDWRPADVCVNSACDHCSLYATISCTYPCEDRGLIYQIANVIK
jgi:hypothetical protein